MKTKHLLAVALLALLGGTAAVRAQTVTAGLNNLILGFRATGGTGASINLEVNLGNASSYYNVSGTVNLSGLSVSDLSAAYGSNWFNRSDLFWGVAGSTGSAVGTTIGGNPILAKTLWGTAAETTLGVQSTAWNRLGAFSQQAAANTIATMYTGALGSLNGATATGNSATAALLDTSLAGSWSKQEGNNAAAFGSQMTKSGFENGTPGNAGVVSDLYELQPGSGSGTYLGSFALNASGLSYSGSTGDAAAAAVPEPSTYAAIFGALAMGFAVLRRRQRKE